MIYFQLFFVVALLTSGITELYASELLISTPIERIGITAIAGTIAVAAKAIHVALHDKSQRA